MPGMNPSEIRVAGTGRILVAKAGTDGPADTTVEWGPAWRDLGYTSTDGVKFSRKGAVRLGVTFTALAPKPGAALATWLMKDKAYAVAPPK
ncbi:hypothetical protein [Streptomyces sp. I05A-00742]|uniref:phage tail tube protein n=1 Tax=Streptomyces sp. I05A-00742 TaxID=2732853 RepID=UPI00148824FA|nr:hypothetical protein [Streptomyces sp. I05A-00742]